MCDRVLHGDQRIRLTYVIFDVLKLDGETETTLRLPLCERHRLLVCAECGRQPRDDENQPTLAAYCDVDD